MSRVEDIIFFLCHALLFLFAIGFSFWLTDHPNWGAMLTHLEDSYGFSGHHRDTLDHFREQLKSLLG